MYFFVFKKIIKSHISVSCLKIKIFNRFSEIFALPDFTHKLITSQVVEEIKNLESIENNKKEEIDNKSFLKKKYGNQIY